MNARKLAKLGVPQDCVPKAIQVVQAVAKHKRAELIERRRRQEFSQDRLLPIAPEFAEFLLATPEEQRHGRVFRPAKNGQLSGDVWISEIVSRIGEAATVKVSEKTKRGPETGGEHQAVKWASDHDLRRSLGERWAGRVTPQVLKEFMRHESIETTLRYYVGRNAQTTADAIGAAYDPSSGTRPSNKASNTGRFSGENGAEKQAQETTQAPAMQGLSGELGN